jgi:hypothetical protein
MSQTDAITALSGIGQRSLGSRADVRWIWRYALMAVPGIAVRVMVRSRCRRSPVRWPRHPESGLPSRIVRSHDVLGAGSLGD